jgi:hypothetical protein
MECILSVKSDTKKGEAIALRYLLLTSMLTGMYEAPHATLPIYELRSSIIHGSARSIAGPVEYIAMRSVAMVAVSLVIRLVQKQPEIRDIGMLIDFLERDDERIEWVTGVILRPSAHKFDRAIQRYADDVLKRLRENQNSFAEHSNSNEQSCPGPATE